ncbi:hypothetical protein EJB05_01004, partial [Eragrostis curvula]
MAASKAMQLFVLLWLSASISITYGQPSSSDFISIDCGIAADKEYNHGRLHFVSDVNFTDAGNNAPVNPKYYQTKWPVYQNLRYFLGSDGERSCYTLRPVMPGSRYLLRARFYHGAYDGPNSGRAFDIHIGVNRWTTVNIISPCRHAIEAVTVSTTDFLQVCLVNTGKGTPFISGLELRPLGKTMYPEAMANQSLLLLRLARPNNAEFLINRYHFGTTDLFINYPDDPYDRSWQRYNDSAWTTINSKYTVNFQRTKNILQTAATPKNGTRRMDFSWSSDLDLKNDNATYLLLLYFAELEMLPRNALRQFDILVDNTTWNGSRRYTPSYLSADVVKTTVQGSSQHAVSLVATPDATHPPILNAFEIYSVKPMTELATNSPDAKTMMTIRNTYALKTLKKNWMGDPCSPKEFTWDGLNCSYSSSGTASVTSLSLSSSGLTGVIDASFGDLKSMERLVDNNALCDNGASMCGAGSNKKLVIATLVPIAVVVLLFAGAFFVIGRMRKRRDKWVANSSRLNTPRNISNILENRRFTYKELKVITANFREEIGRGGFGGVFLGYLEDESPVAVKMHSKTSSQGNKEFLAEAQHLSRVHHRNLVSLIGYCKDKKHLALVYEYMHGGNLEDRLRGLEYLHKSCQPPLIHRDVKTRNILMSADLVAKIADFGLMKAFANEFMTHITTMPAGTLGYLDPEYYHTSQLSDKSDVYSFGVVLLELITGRPPAVPISSTESIHIALWVRQKLSEGDIMNIVDPRMGGEYDINYVWKVAELALQCKEEPSWKRPTMTDVVVELKECLALEVSHALSYYSSVPSSANDLSVTSQDIRSEPQASDYPRQQDRAMLELE